MLISLVLVSLLGALVLTVTRQMRGRATEAGCAGNLRQIGAANLAYAADHNGRIAARNNSRDENGNLTPRTEWYRYIWRTYFQAANGDGTAQGDTGHCTVLICPADTTKGGGDSAGESLRRSYNVNQALATKKGSRRLNEVESLHATIYAGDIDWVAAGKERVHHRWQRRQPRCHPEGTPQGQRQLRLPGWARRVDRHLRDLPRPLAQPHFPTHLSAMNSSTY